MFNSLRRYHHWSSDETWQQVLSPFGQAVLFREAQPIIRRNEEVLRYFLEKKTNKKKKQMELAVGKMETQAKNFTEEAAIFPYLRLGLAWLLISLFYL